MKSDWTIFTMVYEDYNLLRNFIESILANVDPKTYSKIIILDDYSRIDTKLREYEEYLSKDRRFEVITFPEYRLMAHYTEEIHMRESDPKNFNLGHGGAFNYAIKYFDTEFVLYLDVDSIFLESARNILQNLTDIFRLDEKIMAVGQLFGTIEEGIIYDSNFKFYHVQAGRDSVAGGFLGPSAGALRVSGWRDGFIPKFVDDRTLPNLFNRCCEAIFENGGKTASYPWFTKMEILHLGRGIVRRWLEDRRDDIEGDADWFVFCNDFVKAHGPRLSEGQLVSNHYGRGFVRMTSREYRDYIEYKGSKPFEVVNPPLDERFVYTVDNES